MHALDLFAGAGGWDLAADALGIHADGVELMPEAVATRAAADLSTVHDDVWTLDPAAAQGYDGLIASPPCQTFSTAGKGSGRKALDDVLYLIRERAYADRDLLRSFGADLGDDRTALVLSPLHYATAYPFRWLAWEQVPTVLPVWEACAEVLREQGWHVWTGNMQAEQYGVPQTRKRAVLIASRDHAVDRPTPTHSRFYGRTPDKLDADVLPWVSMAEAMQAAGEWAADDLIGFPRRADTADTVTIGGVEYRARDLRSASLPAQTVTEKARSWQRFTHMGDVYNTKAAVRTVDMPAPTVLGSMDNGNYRWHERPAVMAAAGTSSTVAQPRSVDHPAATITGKATAEWGHRPGPAPAPKSRDERGRRLEVHEAGILQSFPADHPWQGNRSKQYLQAGNAIPPGLARAVLVEALGLAAAARGPVDLLDLLAESAA